MKNGIPIRSKLGIQLDQMENYASLNISNATMSDSGRYTVVIENGVGKDQTEFNVSVKGNFNSLLILLIKCLFQFFSQLHQLLR